MDSGPEEDDEDGQMTDEQAWTDDRRRVLRTLCDTWVAAVDPPRAAPDSDLWARTASDIGVADQLAPLLDRRLADDERAGVLALLDALRAARFDRLPRSARAALLAGLTRASTEAAAGLDALRRLTLVIFYGEPTPQGPNPNWQLLGYPGPPAATSSETTSPATAHVGADGDVLDADVVVVGSGSGGAVAAAELATAGRRVVVLEAGDHLDDTAFPGTELAAMERLYWRGGYTPTADENVTLLAGGTVGGGSTVNWTNCVPPPASVRAEWAGEHGLTDLEHAGFDAHLDAVLTRISATEDCSDLSGPNQRLRDGAKALGLSWGPTRRNTDAATYDPASAGHLGYGDSSGSKQSTAKTYLRDLAAQGGEVVVRCHATRVLVERGRAVGVEATHIRADGRRVPVTVHARDVVVAGGALETPALLLRSDIGGPAVGHHLHLHPVPALTGVYPDDQRGWWGAPQTVIVDAFRELSEGYGFLVETAHFGPGLLAASLPWRGARDNKVFMARHRDVASFIAVTRDRGSGRVTLDGFGDAVIHYPLDDELDRAHLRRAVRALAELHRAAGAEAIVDLHPDRPIWSARREDDFAAFLDRVETSPAGNGARPLFSAHQMGSARMGTDPATSVADPDGQLHDTAGVWIADTSAFPTAVGSNPMVTCMALARRTAHALLASDAGQPG